MQPGIRADLTEKMMQMRQKAKQGGTSFQFDDPGIKRKKGRMVT